MLYMQRFNNRTINHILFNYIQLKKRPLNRYKGNRKKNITANTIFLCLISFDSIYLCIHFEIEAMEEGFSYIYALRIFKAYTLHIRFTIAVHKNTFLHNNDKKTFFPSSSLVRTLVLTIYLT